MRGITVKLTEKTQNGTDPFGMPKFTTAEVDVHDVLVGEPSTDDITNTITMYGKKVAYTLAIPKGDTHVWEDTTVTLPAPFEGTYHTIGYPTAGIEANIPLRWNKKVHLERIESESETEQQGNQGSS
jgi:hypothetical protein